MAKKDIHLLSAVGSRYNEKATVLGAQAKRQSEAGLVRDLLDG
jgi:hypothetical protein